MKELVAEVLNNYQHAKRDSLIPILQDVQEKVGFISKEAVVQIGEFLSLPTSKIYGVATFYNQFRFQPKGKHHILVCRGTACHVKGSNNILEALKKNLKIEAGQTTRDGLFSLEVVACLGACGLAPLICINKEFHGNLTNEKVDELIDNIRKLEAKNV